MSRRFGFPFLLVVATSLGFSPSPPNEALLKVRTIYVAELGGEADADLVREKIRLRLQKSGRITVLEKPDGADAILMGVAGVEARYYASVSPDPEAGFHGRGGTIETGVGILRLVDPNADSPIWFFEYKRGLSLSSASSHVARKAVDKLLKDMRAAERAAGRAGKRNARNDGSTECP